MAERMSKEQQIGFHKGAADTLIKEKAELLKMVSIVEQILNGHLNALKQLGVSITSLTSQMNQAQPPQQPQQEQPIETEENDEDDEDDDW